ncbi:MAG TPA: TatD family hydrolase [Pantanalinema sp.]
MRFIDSHCHLDMLPGWVEGELSLEDSWLEIERAVQRAQDAGVEWMLNPGSTWAEMPAVLAVAERYAHVFAAVGIHPHEADSWDDASYERLKALAAHPKVLAIGEIGLDYYYDHGSREAQHRAFREQLRLAKELGLPVIVHTRDAEEDTVAILKEEGATHGVIHCFTGSTALAQATLEMGFHISFSGVVTFKKSEELRATAKVVPLDRTLIETDAPYLAPPPHRGKRNEPAFVVKIAEALAEVHGVGLVDIAERSTENALRLFRFPTT